MKPVTFFIEKTNTGYSAYAQEYGIVAVGKTHKAVQKDARDGLETQCDYLNEDLSQYEVKFTYDFAALIAALGINMVALGEFIGMNPKLIEHYTSGRKKPSAPQKERLEQGLRQYAQVLLDFKFA